MPPARVHVSCGIGARSTVRVDLLDYSLPPELIAQRPLAERGAARMLVVPRIGPPRHQKVADLTRCIPGGSLVVVNDTRVIPARILGRKKTGGKAEIFLVERIGEVVVYAHAERIAESDQGVVPPASDQQVGAKDGDAFEIGVIKPPDLRPRSQLGRVNAELAHADDAIAGAQSADDLG